MILQNEWPRLTLTKQVYIGYDSLKWPQEHIERGETWGAFLRFFTYKLIFLCSQDLRPIEHLSEGHLRKAKRHLRLQRKHFLIAERCSDVSYKFCSEACSEVTYGIIIITCHMFGIKPTFIRFSRGRAIPITRQISRTPSDLVYYYALFPVFLFLRTKGFCVELLPGGGKHTLTIEERHNRGISLSLNAFI